VNVDEALAIVEVLLDDDQQLTDVQEIIFRECWQGRHSYEEIAEIHKYDHEYIKSTGSKLWKYLSEAFGEKVKKANLKSVITRYLRRQNISFNRNLEVNFHGEHKQNSHINVEYEVKEFTQNNLFNFNPAENLDDECQQSDQFVPKETMITTQLEKNIQSVYQNGQSNKHQNLLEESQTKIINVLHETGLLFFTDLHLPIPINQHNTEKYIVVCHAGKLGMIIISQSLTPNTEVEENNSRQQTVLVQAGIHLVKTYTCQQCCQESEQIVQDFLAVLQES
jgi:hypothetical protein